MKKLIIIMAAAMMAVGSSAQVVTSRTIIRAKSQTTWFARLGMSIDNLTNGNKVVEYEKNCESGEASVGSKVGMDLTVGFMKNIGKSGLYWGMDLGIGTRGATCKENGYETDYEYIDGDRVESRTNYTNTGSVMTWNFKYSPFTIGYKYSVTDDLKLDGHLGAYISYDFAGGTNYKWDTDDDKEKLSFSEMKDEEWDYQPLDAGLQIGIGAWWKKFNFDITYQRGFVPAANVYNGDGYSDICSSNLMLRVGYAF